MTRVLSTLCLAIFLMGLGGGSAFAKPSIAVLGLEVIDPSGTPTAQDTQVAKDLTDGLRARAKTGTGTYQLAPGSDKELIDLKLLNNCDNEATGCMSAIGNQLGADILMFGNVKKDGKNYQVTLRVLDVGKKTVQKSSSDLIPAAEASGASLQGWAKRIYAKLTGEANTGTIVVRVANADRGTILIDGEAKGNITAGSGQVAGLSEGKYKLTVESDGFRRWDRDVTVSAGQTATIPVELERGGGAVIGGGGAVGGGPSPGRGPEGGSGSGMWKGVFVGSMLVAAGGAGWWAYNYSKLNDIEAEQCSYGQRPGCTATASPPAGYTLEQSNKDGDAASRQTYIGGIVMGVGLGVAAFAFYKGFIAKGDASRETNASRQRGKRQRRDRFVVTPIVATDGGGATVRLDW
jgi:hypothetical protein